MCEYSKLSDKDQQNAQCEMSLHHCRRKCTDREGLVMHSGGIKLLFSYLVWH